MRYEDYIEINPAIRFGKPCIQGTRISVQDILEMLAGEMTFADIIEEFPQLDVQKNPSCLVIRSFTGAECENGRCMKLLIDANLS